MLKNAFWLFAFAIVLLFIFLPSYTRMQDLERRNLDYEQQMAHLEEKNVALKEEVRRLRDDPEYLERVARERLGLIREGEVVYRIVPGGGLEEVP